MLEADRKAVWSLVFAAGVLSVELVIVLFVWVFGEHAWEFLGSAAFWTAILTGILAASSIFLWLVTWSTLKHDRESSERRQRAYLAIKPLKVEQFVRGQSVNVSLRAINHGLVPASGIRSYYRIDILPPNPLPRAFNHSPADLADTVEFTVFPRDRGTLVFHSDFQLSSADETDVLNGVKHVHVWGVTHYSDGFSKQRTTTFDASSGGKLPGQYWNYGHGHNTAT